jgi:glycosyltransferase involved in cell wall biosynthesis
LLSDFRFPSPSFIHDTHQTLSLVKFTIVTPHFNQLEWLRLCVASVADQASERGLAIEHIVQDAGSAGIAEFARAHDAAIFPEDGLSTAADNALSPHPYSTYRLSIYRERDSGMYDAINRGFRRAKGEVVAWLNADEQYLPGTLAKVARAMTAHPESDILMGDAVVTDPSGAYLCSRTCLTPNRLHSLVSGNLSFLSAATFLRRSVIDRGLFLPASWRVVGDAAWAVELLDSGVTMRRIPAYLSAFADTGDNLCLRPEAAEEMARLAKLAPRWARYLRPAITAWFRFRKLLSGAYRLAPFSYEVYAKENAHHRQNFEVNHPTQRWPGR